MIWASTLQIRTHGYFGDLDFIILFVGILPLYAINLGVVSLFEYSPFTFIAMFVFDILYRFEWMNIVLFLSKQKQKKSERTFLYEQRASIINKFLNQYLYEGSHSRGMNPMLTSYKVDFNLDLESCIYLWQLTHSPQGVKF